MTAPPRRRVLHLITTLDRGGAENALLHLCRGLVGTGRWDVRVAFLKGGGELTADFEDADVPVTDLGLGTLRNLREGVRAVAGTRRLLADFEPDVVHTHLFKADCVGAAVAGRRVLVSTKHNEDAYLAGNDPVSLAWRTLGKGAARRADAVVAITHGVERFVREHLGDAPARLETIRYGVPEPAPGDGPRFRAAHGLAAGAFVVLCSARFEPQKDHETLFAAFELLDDPGARLVLLGRGSREEELRAIAGERVVFAGFVADPSDAYAAADVVALASRHEGLGLVLVEAALAGVPAIATAVGGIPEALPDDETDVLVPAGDVNAFAEALARVSADPELRAARAERARRFARERFSVERCVREHESLYDDLLEGGA